MCTFYEEATKVITQHARFLEPDNSCEIAIRPEDSYCTLCCIHAIGLVRYSQRVEVGHPEGSDPAVFLGADPLAENDGGEAEELARREAFSKALIAGEVRLEVLKGGEGAGGVTGEDDQIQSAIVDENPLQPNRLGSSNARDLAIGTTLARGECGSRPVGSLAVEEVR